MRYRFLRYPGGKTKAVTLSYDDGSKFDIRLCEILNRYGIKCTFNICSGFMSDTDEYYMSVDEIKKHILAQGHEVAVHGKYHKAPGKTAPCEFIRDVLECRAELENSLGTLVRGMAYPDSGIEETLPGINEENIKHTLSDLGIAYARSGRENPNFELPQDLYDWRPGAHHASPALFGMIERFNDCDVNSLYMANRTPKLLYIWGHSSEFDRNSNWDLFEIICQAVSHKPDTWYATAIEICDYITAYNRLVYSADAKTVYNPTATTLFFETDRAPYSIAPGETITVYE